MENAARTKDPRRFWLSLILPLFAFLVVFVQPVKADNQDVLDQANVLSESTQSKIKKINDNELSKIKGHPQIAVVTRNSLAGTKADVIDEYGQQVFDKYHFGRKGYDNGILIVILQDADPNWLRGRSCCA